MECVDHYDISGWQGTNKRPSAIKEKEKKKRRGNRRIQQTIITKQKQQPQWNCDLFANSTPLYFPFSQNPTFTRHRIVINSRLDTPPSVLHCGRKLAYPTTESYSSVHRACQKHQYNRNKEVSACSLHTRLKSFSEVFRKDSLQSIFLLDAHLPALILQHNTTQRQSCNTTQPSSCNTTQHNTTQHNTTQRQSSSPTSSVS